MNAQIGQEPAQPTSPPYAGWGRRAGAWVVDVLLLFGVFVIVPSIVIVAAVPDPDAQEGVAYLLYVPLAFLWPLYFALCHSRPRGQTLGKRLADIAVRDEKTGGRLPLGRALGRAYFMLMLWSFLFIPFVVDVLWPLWDERRQALHDKVVRTIVIRTVS